MSISHRALLTQRPLRGILNTGMAYTFYLFDRSIGKRCIICNQKLTPGHKHLSKAGNELLFGNKRENADSLTGCSKKK
jgi:hypothetical protein